MVIIWIAVNSYFSFKLFFRGNRAFFMTISRFSTVKLYMFLWGIIIIINLQWYIFLIFQMILALKAEILNAVIISTIQFLLAIAIGAFCSSLWKKNIGLILIGLLGIYNFVVCNPYYYEGASHPLFLSEALFTVNDLNYTNLSFLLLYTMVFAILGYRFLKRNTRYGIQKNLVFLSGFIFMWCAVLAVDVSHYQSIQKKEYENISFCDSVIYFRGISEQKAKEIGEILYLFEKEYENMKPKAMGKEKMYKIDKVFLPSVIWEVYGEKPKVINIREDYISLKLLSRNMFYFEQVDLLKCFMEEINLEFSKSVDCYNENKYTRHLIDGYAMEILSNVSQGISLENAQIVHEYYEKYNKEFLEMSTTKFNFVKKIGITIYKKYSKYAAPVYDYVMHNEIQNDEEFLNILKNHFANIYYDEEIQEVVEELGY